MDSKLLFIFTILGFCFSCKQTGLNNDQEKRINCINQDAFEMRNNTKSAVEKTKEALYLIENSLPNYSQGKAVAWNNLGVIYFLQNNYDSAKVYVNKVKEISSNYPNKKLEEDIANMTLANIYHYERELDLEIQIYFEQLNLFQIGRNGLDVRSSYTVNHNDTFAIKRFYFAQSFLYFGLLTITQRKEDRRAILEVFYDKQKFPPAYLDTCQMNDLFYRRAYNNYLQSKNESLNIPERSEFLNKCFIDLEEWLKWLSSAKDIQHIAFFYEFFARVINDKGSENLIKTYSEDVTFNTVKNNLMKRLNCENTDSLSLRLLNEAYRLSKQGINGFDQAWYSLQLGNYFYDHGNITESDKWYGIYSEIELEKLKDNNGHSWKMNKKDNKGYQLFLQKECDSGNSSYIILQKIFEKENGEEFHDDSVLLNQIVRLQKLLLKEKSLYNSKNQNFSSFVILSCILFVLLILVVIYSLQKKKMISNIMKNNDSEDIMRIVQKASQKDANRKDKVKIIKKKIFKILLIILLICIFSYILWISWKLGTFLTLIFGIPSIISLIDPQFGKKLKTKVKKLSERSK